MKQVQLGLKENWKQFTLLVIINGFVGGMVGLERSILPQIAEQEFAIAAKTAILSFPINVCNKLELDHCCKCFPGHQPGTCLVEYSCDED